MLMLVVVLGRDPLYRGLNDEDSALVCLGNYYSLGGVVYAFRSWILIALESLLASPKPHSPFPEVRK